MATTAGLTRPARAALATFALLLPALALSAPARADLLIYIDKTEQRMNVSVDGETLYDWPVSSGLRKYETPSGRYQPFRMVRDHFSREWDWAPMPHSIFFTKRGHAIHGSQHRKAIGRPASHGCVRLKEEHARILFALVRKQKMANTLVVLAGETPDVAKPAAVAARTPEREEVALEPAAPGAADRAIVELEPGELREYGPLPHDLRPGQPIPPRYAREFRNGAPVYYEYNGRLYAEPPPIMREEREYVPPPPPPVRRRYYRDYQFYRRF